MEKIFLVETTSGSTWEVVGGQYLVKGIDDSDVRTKFIPRYTDERIVLVTDIDKIEFEDGVFVLNHAIEE